MGLDFCCVIRTQDIGYLVELPKTVSVGQDASYNPDVQDFTFVSFSVIHIQLSVITMKGKMPDHVSEGLNNH